MQGGLNADMDTLAKRVKARRQELGMTQDELALQSGLKQPDISKIERGLIQKTTGMIGLSRALKCSPDWLDTGDGEMLGAGESNLVEAGGADGEIPLISWVIAGEFCESPDNFHTGDAEDYLPRPLSSMGKNTFALTVRGDSMNVEGGYQEGEIVYVDPDKQPWPGCDVVAKVDNKVNLKRYKVDSDGPYLLQLNGNKIIRPEEPWSVCGVVVFSGKRR